MGKNQVEKSLIELIRQRSKTPGGIPGLGIGDDAAFLLLSSMEEGKLVVSTDSVVENVHYKTGWCGYADVAVKLVERASSDLLAKGGHPHWALLNMNITEEFSHDSLSHTGFIDAFCEKLQEHGIALIGGDITRSATNSFTMTVLGNTSTFVRRSSGELEVGDLVVAWGRVGGSSYVLEQLDKGRQVDDETAALYRRPRACWDNSWLKELHARVSMDQSDSVGETLETLAAENQIALKIHLDLIPRSIKVEGEDIGQAVQNILKAAEDLAVFAIIPSAELPHVGRFNDLCVIGEVLEIKTAAEAKPETALEKTGLRYFWKNQALEVSADTLDLYRHF